jgi:haloalkane dehalogenase
MATVTMKAVNVDGLRIAYRELGEGPPALLLHGWPTSSHLWRNVMPMVARANRAIAVDLPGFGASDKPLDRRYDFDLFERTLDVLTSELGLSKLGLVVHDISGPIGVRWAIHNPGRVTKLALLNTLLHPEGLSEQLMEFLQVLTNPETQQRITGPEGLEVVLRNGMANPSRLTPELLVAIREPFQTEASQRALAAAGAQLSPEGMLEIAERLPELKMPVRIIYGARDTALPVAEEFARVKRALPHAVVTALEDCGHFLQEDAPERVGSLLSDFLTESERQSTALSS